MKANCGNVNWRIVLIPMLEKYEVVVGDDTEGLVRG